MKKYNYLFFSKTEIRGIFAVSILIIIVLLLYFVDFGVREKYSDPATKESILRFLNGHKKTSGYSKSEYYSRKSAKNVKIQPVLKTFDPNKMTKEEWKVMGLSDFQIKMLTNYTSKGGKFKKAEDLSRIYGMDTQMYKILKPYIQIDTNSLKPNYLKIEKRKFSIEINAATIEEMLDIPGIGPGFAKRIIAYKERLGGYYDSTQLLEVFGMDTIKYRQILPYFVYQKDSIHKKEINKEDFRALIKHPYISKKTAYRIIQYRQQFGDIKTTIQLKKALQLSDNEFNKLIEYIKI